VKKVGNPRYDNASLARTRARQDQNGSVYGFDSLQLWGIEIEKTSHEKE